MGVYQIFRVACHGRSSGSSAIVPSWVQNFFSWVFRGSKIFTRGYLWARNVFSWVFRGTEMFSRGYFVGRGYFVAYFVIQRFSFDGCMRKSGRKQKYKNKTQTEYSIPNRFQQLSVLFILGRYFIY